MSKLLVSLALLLSSVSAMAAAANPPVPHFGPYTYDGRFYIVDPDKPVEIIYKGGHRAHANRLFLFTIDKDGKIADPRQAVFYENVGSGQKASFSLTPDTELYFSLINVTTTWGFLSGPYYDYNAFEDYSKWSNRDGHSHTRTSYDDANNRALVSFEDLMYMPSHNYFGDEDYDDFFFIVTNVSRTPPTVISVPEPETYAMFLAGLGILGAVTRRRNSR